MLVMLLLLFIVSEGVWVGCGGGGEKLLIKNILFGRGYILGLWNTAKHK